MKFIDIKSLYRETNKYLDQIISVAGWVRTVRLSKDLVLLSLMTEHF